MIVFSLEQLLAGFLNPRKYYNVGLHEYLTVQRLLDDPFASITQHHPTWDQLEQVNGQSKTIIEEWIGMKNLDRLTVAAVYYFDLPTQFSSILPELSEKLEGILIENQRFTNHV